MNKKVISVKKQKVLLFTMDSAIGDKLIDRVKQSQYLQLCGVVFSERIFKRSSNILSGLNIARLSGYRYMWYLLRITFLRDKRSFKRISRLLQQNNIPVIHTNDVNTGRMIERFKQLAPDMILSCYFNQLIKRPVLDLPYKVLNIHAGLIPQYRGVEAIMPAILNREPALGVTLHKVNEELDAGEVLAQDKIPYAPALSLLDWNITLMTRGIGLLENYLQGAHLEKYSVPENNYYSWPTRQDVNSFLKISALY